MARLFKLTELESRRRALAGESDLFREMIHLETQNLRLYGLRVRRKYGFLSPANPLVAMFLPYVGSWFSRRRQRLHVPRLRWLSYLITGWRVYRRFSPLLALLRPRPTRVEYAPEVGSQQERVDSML